MTAVVMPRLSDSMEEGTVIQWLAEHGTLVKRGDDLLEVETDKATVTYQAEAAGIVQHVVSAGETVPTGTIIAHIVPADEQSERLVRSAPPPAMMTTEHHDGARSPRSAAPAAVTRAKASPVARRLAAELGVSLATIEGTGPRGRIVRADIEAAAAQSVEPQIPAAAAKAEGGATIVELTRVQQRIARRMSEAKATIPEFQVTMEADVSALLHLRKQLKEAGAHVSINDFIVRACALALKLHPRVNGSFRDGQIHLSASINIGVAVALPNALVVPVIHDADLKPLGQINTEIVSLAQRVREGTVTPPELSGGTFTVSNLGMFEVKSFTAIVNPGQAAILAVGGARETLVKREGEIVTRSVLALSLSCDHRMLYGADAAAFLSDLRAQLEEPLRLVV